MASALMRLDQLARLGVHHSRDPLAEQPVPQLAHLVLGMTGPIRNRDLHQLGDIAAADRQPGPGRRRAQHFAGRHVAPPDPVLVERRGRVAGDQRSVEVEERADPPPARRFLDLLEQLLEGRHPRSASARIRPSRATTVSSSCANSARARLSSSPPAAASSPRLRARARPLANSSLEIDSVLASRSTSNSRLRAKKNSNLSASRSRNASSHPAVTGSLGRSSSTQTRTSSAMARLTNTWITELR